MAACRKRLKQVVGPLIVAYTVVVTYFLARGAWNDVSVRLRHGSDVRFLDIIEQEEHRHQRTFQSVLNNYRDQMKFSDEKHHSSAGLFLQTDALNYQFMGKIQESDITNNRTRLSSHEIDFLEGTDVHKKPRFWVEVEEWNAPSGRPDLPRYEIVTKNNASRNISSISTTFKTWIRHHQNARRPSGRHENYTTEYCEDVLVDSDSEPTLCKRDLVEASSSRHVSISTDSLLFTALGDIFIFSTFLDTRQIPFFIRLMVLGPQGRGKVGSPYWCVFYLRSPLTSSKTKVSSDLFRVVSDNQNIHRQATQLNYYPASDGHNKTQQFYIMSCPVPEAARNWLLPPFQGMFQIIYGTLQQPFLGASQESVGAKVIRNKANHTTREQTARHKDLSYFDKMKQDLSNLRMFPLTNDNEKLDNNNSFNQSEINNTPGDKIVSCVAPLETNVRVLQLVEFIELTLLLGSQHIVFYTAQVYDETQRVLHMYQRRGLVTAIRWSFQDSESVWAKGRDLALNDCLYRTMHVYDFALFLDVDEFLVPRTTPDLPSFLKYLKVVHRFNFTRFSDLVFSSTYFPLTIRTRHRNLTMADLTKDMTKLVSLRSVDRTYFSLADNLRLIRLSQAFRVGAGERKRSSFTIGSRFAVLHHYSVCPLAKSQNKGNPLTRGKDVCSHTKLDLTMWRYRLVLVQRVKDSIRALNAN